MDDARRIHKTLDEVVHDDQSLGYYIRRVIILERSAKHPRVPDGRGCRFRARDAQNEEPLTQMRG